MGGLLDKSASGIEVAWSRDIRRIELDKPIMGLLQALLKRVALKQLDRICEDGIEPGAKHLTQIRIGHRQHSRGTDEVLKQLFHPV